MCTRLSRPCVWKCDERVSVRGENSVVSGSIFSSAHRIGLNLSPLPLSGVDTTSLLSGCSYREDSPDSIPRLFLGSTTPAAILLPVQHVRDSGGEIFPIAGAKYFHCARKGFNTLGRRSLDP